MSYTTIAGTEWAERARSLKDEGWLLLDLTGLDRLGLGGEPRFEVVVQLLNPERRERRTIHVTAEGDPPKVASVVEQWPTARFMERETFDMFGIVFDGHEGLSRILMPDEWEGHPLRKDYGVGKVPIEFVPQPFMQVHSPGQSSESDEAEREVDRLGQAGPPERSLGNAPGAGARP